MEGYVSAHDKVRPVFMCSSAQAHSRVVPSRGRPKNCDYDALEYSGHIGNTRSIHSPVIINHCIVEHNLLG